jgi:L-gulonolactone oxidase
MTNVDHDTGLATVQGGTSLAQLNLSLAAEGLALENLGDIDKQTITGAISTRTHGTGARFGGLATQVRRIMIMTADGAQLRCSATDHPDIYDAAARRPGRAWSDHRGHPAVRASVQLHAVRCRHPWMRCLTASKPRSAKMIMSTLIKRNSRVPHDQVGHRLPRWRYLLDDELLSNGLFEGINRLGWLRPSLIPRINQFSARVLPPREFTDTSYAVFTSPRRVRFKECEYAVPREAIVPVLRALRAWIDDHDERICFAVEVRVAAADDVWLSTASQREAGYIAVYHYFTIDHWRYFAAFESIVAEHQGRPHWGKLHTLGADQLRQLYPRFDHFRQIRDRLDPGPTFDNAYLRSVLGT